MTKFWAMRDRSWVFSQETKGLQSRPNRLRESQMLYGNDIWAKISTV